MIDTIIYILAVVGIVTVIGGLAMFIYLALTDIRAALSLSDERPVRHTRPS